MPGEALPAPSTDSDYVPDLSLWLGRPGIKDYPAAEQFARLTAALRLLQDRVVAARPPAEVVEAAAGRLEEAARLLGEFPVGEPEQVAARLMDEAGRGQTLVPAIRVEFWDDCRVRGRMRFHRFHLGSNGAAHGGAISLFFDDLLGQLANVPGHPRARTASIRVNYRRVIPIEHELLAYAEIARRDGRKLTIVGELRDGEVVVADAEGLFIQLRPDQR
jgi:acyl-coenzyme A thioesterase PaaI-like protein